MKSPPTTRIRLSQPGQVLATVSFLSVAIIILGGCSVFGPSAEQRKLKALRSDRSRRRLSALKKVKRKPTPRMRVELEQILATDVNPSARALAADALGKLANKESVEHLRLSTHRDRAWTVRCRALRALVGILQGAAADDLKKVLRRDPHPTVRVEAIKLSSSLEDKQVRGGLLLEGLKDNEKAVKLTAYRELQDMTGENLPPDDLEKWGEVIQKQ